MKSIQVQGNWFSFQFSLMNENQMDERYTHHATYSTVGVFGMQSKVTLTFQIQEKKEGSTALSAPPLNPPITSGILRELSRNAVERHELQASVSTAFSSSPKLSQGEHAFYFF